MKFFPANFSRLLFRSALTLFVFCPVFSFAQQSKVDSLQKLLKTATEDTSRINFMNRLAWSYMSIGKYEDGMKNANSAIELGEKIQFEKGLADSYNMLGNIFLQQGDLKSAEKNFIIVMERQKERGDKNGMAAAYNNLALVYDYQGELGKALENYLAAVKLNTETGNRNWLANNYNNMGSNYYLQGKMDKSLESFITAKKIKEEIGETKDYQYANTIGNIGNIYFEKKQYDKAMEIHNTAFAIRKEIGDEHGISDSYTGIGTIFFEQSKTEKDSVKRKELQRKAEQNIKEGLSIKEKIGDMYGVSLSLYNLGSLHVYQKQTELARKELLRALEISMENGVDDITRDVYFSLSSCDSVEGNWKGAYGYHKLYKQYNDSLFNDENSKKIAEMNTRFETEKKEAQISMLEKERKQTWLFGGIFIVLVIIALYFAARAYNNKKKVAAFMASESNRKEMLLQEVHHRINNNLQIISSLLTLQANSARDEKLQEYLMQSQNRIQSLSVLHDLLYQTDSPLKIAMKGYLEKVLDFHKEVLRTLPAKVEVLMNVKDEKFATKLAVPVALIVNELVTNSIKYAFSGNTEGYIKIELYPHEVQAGKWMLRISDSGKGLPEEDGFRKDSLGLRLVRIMTKQIAGVMEKKNSPGATFEIVFSIPVSDK